MKLRFQADTDFNQNIVTGILRRNPAIDFQSAFTAGLDGLDDRQVLELAAQSGRLLVSHDRRTLPQYFAEFMVSQTSAGVLIVSQNLGIGTAIEALLQIWEISDAEDWTNRIMYIPF